MIDTDYFALTPQNLTEIKNIIKNLDKNNVSYHLFINIKTFELIFNINSFDYLAAIDYDSISGFNCVARTILLNNYQKQKFKITGISKKLKEQASCVAYQSADKFIFFEGSFNDALILSSNTKVYFFGRYKTKNIFFIPDISTLQYNTYQMLEVLNINSILVDYTKFKDPIDAENYINNRIIFSKIYKFYDGPYFKNQNLFLPTQGSGVVKTFKPYNLL